MGLTYTAAHITSGQAFIIALWYYFMCGSSWTFGMGYYSFAKPLFSGYFVGLVLGLPYEGMIIGAQINLLYIANISAGGSQAADPLLAGVLGTALALGSGANYEQALVFAVAIGLAGNLRHISHMTVNSTWTHFAERHALKGNYKGIFLWQVVIPQALYATTAISLVYLATMYGPEYVVSILTNLPQWAVNGLSAVGGVLPAVGICMNLNLIGKANTIPFFFIGFMLVKYLAFSNVVVAVIGALIAYIGVFGVKPRISY